MASSYPGTIITWVSKVDNVNYNYAADINSAITEIRAIGQDLVGVGGTAGGLAQGGGSFYTRWTAQHTTAGAHTAITGTSVNVSGNVTAATFTGALTGAVTGNLTGTVLTAAQGSITSLGTLTSLATSGDILATKATEVSIRADCTGATAAGYCAGKNNEDDCVEMIAYGSSYVGTACSCNLANLGRFYSDTLTGMLIDAAVGSIYLGTGNTLRLTLGAAATFTGVVTAAGYKSSDGSAGLSGTLVIDMGNQALTGKVTLVFKNGLLTSETIATATSSPAITWA